jgi:protocatechuate 3,4-dioxygenase beta subunit
MALPVTPWQTLGPFFNAGLLNEGDDDLTRIGPDGPRAEGEVIEIHGRILQEGAIPVPGALLEIWQANAAGKYDHLADRSDRPVDPHFRGFGRALTDAEGRYRFRTIKPGAVPVGGNRWQAPHVSVSIFAAGLLRRLITRLYFPGEPLNDSDPVLTAIPDPAARATLIAKETASADGRAYVFDIVLRGEDEIAFFID